MDCRFWSVIRLYSFYFFFFCKQKTAYEMRISDWSSDVCSSDLEITLDDPRPAALQPPARLAVARQFAPLIVDNAQLDAERRAALPRDDVDALVKAHIVPVPRPFAHRPARRGFGHAPGLADIAPRLHKPPDHPTRTPPPP